MAREVVWAYAAEEDLGTAAVYIHRDSPAYAASFVNRALQAGRSLSELAERGRMVPEFMDEKIREIFVYSYRLIYRIEHDCVSVLGLVHGRRDFQTAWGEKNRE
jgi:toxin ParE1/3/4